jgi:chromatin remodeling complex protein RSC6
MSKQTKASKTEVKEATKPTEVKDTKPVATPAAAAPAVEGAAKKPRAKKEAAAPAAATEKSDAPATEEAASEPSKRRQVTREGVEGSFEALEKQIGEEIDNLRKNDTKSGPQVRFLRSVLKQTRQLRIDSLRIASKKVRRTTTSASSGNSGFMKPVEISKSMRDFTGLKENQLVSRVDVTKSICKYVKDHNLQNKDDRRHFTPDEKLAKLLGTANPLTYYALQQQIQPHFVKPAESK